MNCDILKPMYYCPKCQKEITVCPNCKQRVSDTTALLLYQIAAVCFIVAAIFFMLELELQEETAVAMKPFKESAEIAEKKAKIEEVKLPKPPKPPKPPKQTSAAQAPKKGPIRGQTADFRSALWGTPRSRIAGDEKIQLLNDSSAYDLDYLDRISNLDTVVRYRFSSNRLDSGYYIFLGDKCLGLEQLDRNAIKKIGESTDKEVQAFFAIFPMTRNKELANVKSIEQFYSETLDGLLFQLGTPVENNMEKLDNRLTPAEKVASVIVFNRMLRYSWDTPRSIVDLVFAAHENRMYLSISYHNRKTAK